MKAFGMCTPHVAGLRGYDLRLDFSLVPQTGGGWIKAVPSLVWILVLPLQGWSICVAQLEQNFWTTFIQKESS